MRGRGEGWVVAQSVLMGFVVAAGFVPSRWPEGARTATAVVGASLALAGLVFAVRAARTLGRSLTPFPRPVPAGLVEAGPYRLVRHPIYLGGLLFFGGYALFTASVAALVLTGALGLLWAGKARVEERLLAEVYPEYAGYTRRVRARIIPFVY